VVSVDTHEIMKVIGVDFLTVQRRSYFAEKYTSQR
jgi:hypothetical protein